MRRVPENTAKTYSSCALVGHARVITMLKVGFVSLLLACSFLPGAAFAATDDQAQTFNPFAWFAALMNVNVGADDANTNANASTSGANAANTNATGANAASAAATSAAANANGSAGDASTPSATATKITPTADMIVVTPPEAVPNSTGTSAIVYDGAPKMVSATAADGITGMGSLTISYYTTDANNEPVLVSDAPIYPGTYTYKISVAESETYEAATLESAAWNFTIEKAPLSVDRFTFAQPENLLYDGTAKAATVLPDSENLGIGAVSLEYYSVVTDGALLEEAVSPVDAGTYQVKINVEEGANYQAAVGLTSTNWRFTIEPVSIESAAITVEPAQWSGSAVESGVLVTLGSAALEQNKDYAVTYANNIEVGNTAEVYIEGIGNYTGSAMQYFSITKATPTCATPAGVEVYYSQTLGEVALPSSDEGAWVWLDADTVATTIGTQSFDALFVPTDDVHYEQLEATVEVQVQPLSIKVAAKSATKTEGEVDPELQYVVSEETPLVAGDALSGSLARESGEKPGKYRILIGTLANPNYAIEFTSAELTIKAAPTEKEAATKNEGKGSSISGSAASSAQSANTTTSAVDNSGNDVLDAVGSVDPSTKEARDIAPRVSEEPAETDFMEQVKAFFAEWWLVIAAACGGALLMAIGIGIGYKMKGRKE